MNNDQINALLDRVEHLVLSGKMSPKDFAEKMLDHLEHLLLSGEMSPKDYASSVVDLSAWEQAKRRMT
jgi:hypothetical protein